MSYRLIEESWPLQARERRGPTWTWVEEVDGETQLDVSCMDLGDDGLAELLERLDAESIRLDRLDLTDNGLSARGGRALVESEAVSTLRHLSFRGNHMSAGALAEITRRTWPRLERLDLHRCDISSEDWRALGATDGLRSLRRLAVVRVGPEGARALADAAALDALERLEVDNHILAADMRQLLGGSGLPSLRELSLLALEPREVAVLMRSPAAQRLTTLEIAVRSLDDRFVEALTSGEEGPRLRRFALSVDQERPSAEDAWARLTASRRFEALSSLRLETWKGLSTREVHGWIEPNIRRLEELAVHLNEDAPLAGLLRHGSKLRTLTVAFSRASSLGALPTTHGCTSLETVSLRNIGAEAVARLAESGLLGQLRELEVHGSSLGDDGASALARHDEPTSLERLVLEDCELTTVGARSLAASRVLEGIRELDLSRNPLGVAGQRALLESPSLALVERLSLEHSDGLAGAVDALARRGHGQLRWLVLDGSFDPSERDAVRRLAQGAALPRLEGLDLRRVGLLTEAEAHELVTSRAIPESCFVRAAFDGRVRGALLDAPPLGPRRRASVGTADAAYRVALEGVGEAHELSLHHIDDDALEAICRSTRFGSIRSLYLSSHHVGVRGARALAASDAFPALSALRIDRTPLGPEGATFVCDGRWPRLTRLELVGVRATDLSFETLAANPCMRRLRSLTVTEAEVGDRGLTALAHGELCSLEGLQINGVPRLVLAPLDDPRLELPKLIVTDAGVAALAETTSLRALRSAFLSFRITAEGGRRLGASDRLDGVETLLIECCDEGAGAAVVRGRGLPALCRFDADATESFARALLETSRRGVRACFYTQRGPTRASDELVRLCRAVNARGRNHIAYD